MNLRTDVPHEMPDTELKSKGRGAVKEALMQLRAEGYPVELPKEAAEDTDEEQLSAEAVRKAYENSIEYRLGCEIMDGLTQSYGLSSEDAEAMLTGEYSPKSCQIIASRAAEVLSRLNAENKLKRPIDSYLEEEGFLSMLRQMPVELAVRIKEAEWEAEGASNARSDGERNAIEKLRARQALPAPMRTIIPASAEPDFATMSSEEFKRFKQRHFGQ